MRRGTYLVIGVAIGVVATSVFFITDIKDILTTSTNQPPVVEDVLPDDIYNRMTATPDEFLFIDVRSASSFKALHAEGAINIPIGELFIEKSFLPKDKTIVLICSGDTLSGVAYGFLEYQGFQNLLRVQDGTAGWKRAGLPIVEGQ